MKYNNIRKHFQFYFNLNFFNDKTFYQPNSKHWTIEYVFVTCEKRYNFRI